MRTPDAATGAERPQTPRVKQVVQFAIDEAAGLEHNYVGTEHLLLAMLREGEGVAGQVLSNMNLRYENVRKELVHLLGTGK